MEESQRIGFNTSLQNVELNRLVEMYLFATPDGSYPEYETVIQSYRYFLLEEHNLVEILQNNMLSFVFDGIVHNNPIIEVW